MELAYRGRLLKRRQIHGSRPCAIATTYLFLQILEKSNYKSVPQLLERIRGTGRRLIDAQPRELVVGNVVRRVLGLVREVTEAPPEVELESGHGLISPTSAVQGMKRCHPTYVFF